MKNGHKEMKTGHKGMTRWSQGGDGECQKEMTKWATRKLQRGHKEKEETRRFLRTQHGGNEKVTKKKVDAIHQINKHKNVSLLNQTKDKLANYRRQNRCHGTT